jgi:hypothetical protein
MARDFVAAFVYKGYAIAVKTEIIITTTRISVRVNPLVPFDFILDIKTPLNYG